VADAHSNEVTRFRQWFANGPHAIDKVRATGIQIANQLASTHAANPQSRAAEDVYALGAAMYEAMTGQWPAAGAAPIMTVRPNIPTNVASAIDRSISTNLWNRPSATEVATLLATKDKGFGGVILWCLAGGVVMLVIGFLILRTGDDRLLPEEFERPAIVERNSEAAEEWDEIVRLVEKRSTRESARKLLDEFERKYGESAATGLVRAKLAGFLVDD
jgi:hypothetical protein